MHYINDKRCTQSIRRWFPATASRDASWNVVGQDVNSYQNAACHHVVNNASSLHPYRGNEGPCPGAELFTCSFREKKRPGVNKVQVRWWAIGGTDGLGSCFLLCFVNNIETSVKERYWQQYLANRRDTSSTKKHQIANRTKCVVVKKVVVTIKLERMPRL